MVSKYGGKKHYIYLMGNISSDDRTHVWREIVEDLFKHDPVEILNPCKNQWNVELRKLRLQPESQERDKVIAALLGYAQRALRPKDYQMLKISSIAIWNTSLDDPDRPSMASIVEHTWCIDVFNIPVIMVAKNGSPWLEHSWFGTYNAAVVETIYDAVIYIRELFL